MTERDVTRELDVRHVKLLDQERPLTELSVAKKDALYTKFAAALEGSNESGGGSLAGAPSGTAASPLARVMKSAALLALGGVLGAAAHAVFTSPAATPATVSTPAAPITDASESAAHVIVAAPVEAPRSASSRPVEDGTAKRTLQPGPSPRAIVDEPAGSATASPSSSVAEGQVPRSGSSTLGEERALVERGRAAIARRDGLAALEALSEHSRRFAGGKLAEERDALAVQALAMVGRTDDAARKAHEFAARYPRSVFLPRVESLVRPGDPAGPEGERSPR